ncbi:hypothetical protein DPMN_127813 [Dreissena polymorpha]|uniref:Uncharacterized protein n=1 Tax=Dreissena polymorpha TaxID=45954 RepID=A0A9D4H2N6_DREPO|nr:hypothetical protein DPMN_127813 [Dreissena polymorpha]
MHSGGVQKLGKRRLEREKSCINKAIHVPFKPWECDFHIHKRVYAQLISISISSLSNGWIQ